jgi:hypothetical protein
VKVRVRLCLTIAFLAFVGNAGVGHAQSPSYLALARSGVASAQRAWRDPTHGWYLERLNYHVAYPQATIWGAVPLFEALDGVALASPSAATRAAVDRFAHGAERYFDRSLTPHGGYAPYPGDRGPAETWFDDNGWWGLAFFDAFKATGRQRYLSDAERAFSYVIAAGWDPRSGGLWWNTTHPFKSGEASASNSLLGAELYAQTHRSYYADQVKRLFSWADQHMWNAGDQLYKRSDVDPTPMPYVEGPMIYAHRVLCDATGDQSLCQRAAFLAGRASQRFQELSMGPQFDAIYLRTMLAYGRAAHDGRWRQLAQGEAQRALSNSRVPSGLYLRAWDGSDMSGHQADPNMLRTDAATVSVFAWLAATPGG